MRSSPSRPEPPPLDDAQRAAFVALYVAHLPAIVRYLRRRLGEDAADDAAAEVFLRAFRRPGAWGDDVRPALPWLYGIAANVIHEQRRAERRRLRAIERAAGRRPAPDAPPGPTAGLDPDVARALRRLSAADRETLLLVAWGELSYEETARALEVPVGTVASRLARVRRQLDDALPAGLRAPAAPTGRMPRDAGPADRVPRASARPTPRDPEAHLLTGDTHA
ncbi:RNA polymerase sigma factor [Patulibacter sp. NPDC049589]|uniref:RNA polymerase sigma factor n=1 Tax=Patulibacter sp. NPDC049589 TaxID=3154731 RepID=UPI0034232936